MMGSDMAIDLSLQLAASAAQDEQQDEEDKDDGENEDQFRETDGTHDYLPSGTGASVLRGSIAHPREEGAVGQWSVLRPCVFASLR